MDAVGREAMGRWLRPSRAALAITAAAWTVILALILRHAIFVTNDSLNNYIHVWYVGDRISHAHEIPLHMPLLGHGQALAFPYAFLPWFTAGLLHPLIGDWVVTLWLVIGFVGLVAAQWWAFPELRSGWWTAALLLNPMLVEGPLLGQLPFLWSAALLFAAIACWRRERLVMSTLLLGLSQATHPALMLPIVGVLVVVALPLQARRRQLFAAYLASLAIAAPAIWLTLASPVFNDASRSAVVATFFGTLTLRAIVVAAPFIGLLVLRTPLSRIPAAILVGLALLNLALVPIRHNEFAWTGLDRDPDRSLQSFIGSPEFVPGATYRFLRAGDGKIGMYQLVKAGGRLDSEPFPESIVRTSWPSSSGYAEFLRRREVEYVIIYDSYDTRFRTNEHELLGELAMDAACASPVTSTTDYEVIRVFDLDRCARAEIAR